MSRAAFFSKTQEAAQGLHIMLRADLYPPHLANSEFTPTATVAHQTKHIKQDRETHHAKAKALPVVILPDYGGQKQFGNRLIFGVGSPEVGCQPLALILNPKP